MTGCLTFSRSSRSVSSSLCTASSRSSASSTCSWRVWIFFFTISMTAIVSFYTKREKATKEHQKKPQNSCLWVCVIRVKVSSSEEKNFFFPLSVSGRKSGTCSVGMVGGERERERERERRKKKGREFSGNYWRDRPILWRSPASDDITGFRRGRRCCFPSTKEVCKKKSREVLEFAIVDLYGKRKVLLRLALFPCSDWRQISGGKGAICDSPLTSLIQDVWMWIITHGWMCVRACVRACVCVCVFVEG